MGHRLSARLLIFAMVLARFWRHPWRKASRNPKRILIAHHLLLGDTIMLTPLLAKLREQFPQAEIHMTMQKAVAGLYSGQPYGVVALPFDPKDLYSHFNLINQDPYDVAFIPGDNRYSFLAYAMGAQWIVAFDGDRPAYKSWLVDEFHAYPDQATAWPDMNTDLVDGPYPACFTKQNWPAPKINAIPKLPDKYVVLHVGASSQLKFWPFDRWQSLAEYVSSLGFNVVWSGGPGEEQHILSVDPSSKYINYAGQLNLAQIWHLLKNAAALVCPDTGIAHLARITETPTICLFGPGSVDIHGKSNFWKQGDYFPLSAHIECRNQPYLFKRELSWVKRCGRGLSECAQPECMHRLTLAQVTKQLSQIINSLIKDC